MSDKSEKVKALCQFLGFTEADADRFSQRGYNDNEFCIDEGQDMPSCCKNNEFLVCTEEEADEEYHDDFMDLVDGLGLQSFTEDAQKYIADNFAKSDWFEEAFEESTRSYAEDIVEEDLGDKYAGEYSCTNTEGKEITVKVRNRLFQECLENGVICSDDLVIGENITEEGEWIDGNDDLVEKYCDYFDRAEKLGYEDAIEWFRFDFGEESFKKAVEEHNLIDWEAACEWTKEQDGRGNNLSRWDGKEYEEEVNGTTYYIYPNCDFKALQPKTEKENKEEIYKEER